MAIAYFTFHGALNYFISGRQQNTTISHEFEWKASIKDMVEAIGPPHPEVALLIVNGQSVNWDVIVQPDDNIHAYPDMHLDIPDKINLIPPYSGKPRFILDTHLGKLAAYLRMMGFDTLYRNDYEDDVLAQVSHDEQRILLTRDLGVLKRSIVTYGYFVRNTDPIKRLMEITERYGLVKDVQPFAHCMRCNGRLAQVDKATIRDSIRPDTYAKFDRFHQCQSCQQIYWKGSHFEKMQQLINKVVNGEVRHS